MNRKKLKGKRESRRLDHHRTRQAVKAVLRGDKAHQPRPYRWGQRPDRLPVP